MNFVARVLLLLLLSAAHPALTEAHPTTVAAHAAPPEKLGACADQLMATAPCLTYISSPPNNFASAPSKPCCGVYSAAFDTTGAASCFCILLRRPQLLGFPLNVTKILSLDALCVNGSRSSGRGSAKPVVPLGSLCEGPVTSPPPVQVVRTEPAASPPAPTMPSLPAPAAPSLPPEGRELGLAPSPAEPMEMDAMDSGCYQLLPGIILTLVSSIAYIL